MTKSRGVNLPKVVWTAEMDDQLRMHYSDTLTRDLAAQIGATEDQCYRRARRLGIAKSVAFKSGPMAQRLDGHRGSGCRFQPGHIPWIAGKKLPGYAPGNMGQTQFKKGELSGRNAKSYIPVGGHRINAEGYLDRKVQDGGRPQDRFERVHRLVWIEAHGPIPDGHVVVFRPGMKTTILSAITIDQLECIARSDLARRNQLPPELMKIHQLRGQITRQINQRLKEQSA